MPDTRSSRRRSRQGEGRQTCPAAFRFSAATQRNESSQAQQRLTARHAKPPPRVMRAITNAARPWAPSTITRSARPYGRAYLRAAEAPQASVRSLSSSRHCRPRRTRTRTVARHYTSGPGGDCLEEMFSCPHTQRRAIGDNTAPAASVLSLRVPGLDTQACVASPGTQKDGMCAADAAPFPVHRLAEEGGGEGTE